MRLAFIPPMFPTLVEVPPESDDWIHEIKYDGYRTQLVINAGGIRAFSRRGVDWPDKYRPIVGAAAELHVKSAIIDGEMIAPDANGASDFSLFRKSIKRWPGKLAFVAFDLLHLDGEDLRPMPLAERRALLWSILAPAEAAIQFSQHVAGGGKQFYETVDRMSLEGMVSKRPDSSYRSGPTTAWLKTKCYQLSEFEVAAVLRERGKPPVAYMVDAERNYVGGRLHQRPQPRHARTALATRHGQGRATRERTVMKQGAEWVRPGLKATVRHLKGEEMLRHASLKDIGD